MEFCDRTKMLFGSIAMQKIAASKVAIFGVGGVGGYVAEALARSGVGEIALIDNDTIDITNLNRQILALHSTLGQDKVAVAKARLIDINPNIIVQTYKMFYLPDNCDQIDLSQFDYIVDAIDTVTAKICLIEKARASNVAIISSMGTGNKRDASKLRIAKISETSVCPLARVMRKELKERNIFDVDVLFSTEAPSKEEKVIDSAKNKEIPASFVCPPAVGGLLIANKVLLDIIAKN
ncbi:MAG: tRNA threonylcarbamoyladenosine dehydratase [Clostridia bacterium]